MAARQAYLDTYRYVPPSELNLVAARAIPERCDAIVRRCRAPARSEAPASSRSLNREQPSRAASIWISQLKLTRDRRARRSQAMLTGGPAMWCRGPRHAVNLQLSNGSAARIDSAMSSDVPSLQRRDGEIFLG
eukprot:SAG31_NODE_14300_length_815_cov_2.143855_1_plen_133_part_00